MRVLLLFSGGADSTCLAERLERSGQLAGTLFVDYGQPAARMERLAVMRWHQAHDYFYRDLTMTMSLDGAGDMGSGDGVVQARNLVMIAAGINVAAQVGAGAVWLGCSQTDREVFRDCRPEVAEWMTDAGMFVCGVRVRYPLANRQQHEIATELAGYGVNDVWSCYSPVDSEACGKCAKCIANGGDER